MCVTAMRGIRIVGIGLDSLVPRLLCVGGEKEPAWYTLFAHAQFPQDF